MQHKVVIQTHFNDDRTFTVRRTLSTRTNSTLPITQPTSFTYTYSYIHPDPYSQTYFDKAPPIVCSQKAKDQNTIDNEGNSIIILTHKQYQDKVQEYIDIDSALSTELFN